MHDQSKAGRLPLPGRPAARGIQRSLRPSRLPVPVTAPAVRNLIIASLPFDEAEMLRPHVHRVRLDIGQVLQAPSEPVEAVYFVETGLISLMADTGESGETEVGMVGHDGLVGGDLLLLNPSALATHRALVQAPGTALRMGATAFLDAAEQSGHLRDACLRYLQFALAQAGQLAACNARHPPAERLARWLLMAQDLIGDEDLPFTQETLSFGLGVRGASAVMIMNALASQGSIRVGKGRICVSDRVALEKESCGCYGRLVERWRQITADSA